MSKNMVYVDTSDVDKFLEEATESVKEAVLQTCGEIQQMMLQVADPLIPTGAIDGGTLKMSVLGSGFVNESKGIVEVGIGSNVEYAPYVEYGTGDKGNQPAPGYTNYPLPKEITFTDGWKGMQARPYLRPALYENEQDVAELLAKRTIEGIK